MSKFVIEINLGNAEMQTPEQVAVALAKLAGRMSGWQNYGDAGVILDVNGNAVGTYGKVEQE